MCSSCWFHLKLDPSLFRLIFQINVTFNDLGIRQLKLTVLLLEKDMNLTAVTSKRRF